MLPYMKEADLFIVPIFFGGGVKTKLIEMGCWKKPIVTTEEGRVGTIYTDDDVCIANSPADFALGCINALQHPETYAPRCELEKSVGENDEDNSNLDLFSLEMFEDLAWLMARHADPANVPDSPEEFLDQFNTFSIYQILPQLIELWGLNVQTEVESRKNLAKVSGK